MNAVKPSGIAAENEPAKFANPDITATGEPRASVAFTALDTLWINTGTLCNIECAHCYIQSSPTNDRLAYVTAEQAAPFISEARDLGAREIGLTGGEPFMNPATPAIVAFALDAGFSVLVLTNAMKPMMRPRVQRDLLALKESHGNRLKFRISIDHYSAALHDEERGSGAFNASLAGMAWLSEHGFEFSVAGRLRWGEREPEMRDGYKALFAAHNIDCNTNPDALVLFPEMDADADVPEITEQCWSILGTSPDAMMCASSRMLVLRKGASNPLVLACTLIADDPAFEMGASLAESLAPVKLNHRHCAKFCVLGGASCSG